MNVILLITVLVVILILIFVGYMLFREKGRKVDVSNVSDGGGGKRVGEQLKDGKWKLWGRGRDEEMNKSPRRISLRHDNEREDDRTHGGEEKQHSEEPNNNYPSFSEQINSPVNFDTSLLEVVDTPPSQQKPSSPPSTQKPKISFEQSTPIF